MKFRIIMRKLLFLHHLTVLDNKSLAKQVLTVQDIHDIPGLVTECKGYIQKYRPPNILKSSLTKNEWKKKGKAKMKEENKRL